MPRGNFLGSARHQYGISALVTQTSFCEGSSGDLAKRWLFSQAMVKRYLLVMSMETATELRPELCGLVLLVVD